MQYISDIRNILPSYMYSAVRQEIASPDYKYSLYNGNLLSCAVLDVTPHLTTVVEDLCDIHSNTDTLKSYFFSRHKVFIFISSLSFKCIKKSGEMGSCGASMSTVKIMSLNLVPQFGYYTFINNQISVQRLQASELRKGTESIGGIEFFTYSHKTSHPVNNLALIPARHNTF